MDFRNFTTYAAERRRAGAILGTPPPVDGKRTGVHHCLSTSASDLVDFMDKNPLSKIVTEPTRGDKTLDLALTNVPRYIAEVRVRPTILSDHSLVHALLGFDMLGKAPSSPSECRSPHSFRNADYHTADFDAMNESFISVNMWVLCDQTITRTDEAHHPADHTPLFPI